MKFYVYLLKSLKDGMYYIGSTDNILRGLKQHNSGINKSTKYRTPLDLVGYEIYDNEKEARWREHELKKHPNLKKKFITSLLNKITNLHITQEGFIRLTKHSLISMLIILTVFFGGGFYLLFGPNVRSTEAAWFNDSWGYRKSITLTVTSSSSDITNLQTLLTVDTTGITASLQTNCEDLRFTSVSGKILPYYAPSCSDNSATNKIWVQADLVPKNTTTYTLYMYYGNPSAVAGSDSSSTYNFNLFNGLVGYWSMNESSGNAVDSSGNSVTGTDTSTTVVAGKFGNGRSFNGTTSKFTVSHNSVLSTSGGVTLSSWVKLGAVPDVSTVYMIMAKDGTWSGTNTNYQLDIRFGGKIEFAYRGGDSSGNEFRTTSNVITDTTTWHQITVTYDGTNNPIIYLDGVAQTASYASGGNATLGTNSNSLYLGAQSALYFLNGSLDDTRIYNRALSASEVTQLYNDSTSSILTTVQPTVVSSTSFASEEKAPSPVAYWKFDDGTGTTAQDATVNNNDGTISGSTWQAEDQCIAGKCLYFDGTDDKVSTTDLDPWTDFTTQVWFRAGASSKTYNRLMDKDGGSGNDYFVLYLNDSGNVAVDLRNTSGSTARPTSTANYADNKWHHVIFTRSGSALTLYVDGVSVATATQASFTFNNTTAFAMGYTNASAADQYFKGFLDEPKIFNYARSAAQILADYNSRSNPEGLAQVLGASQGNNPQALSNGLVGYWKEDEASDANATDSSGVGTTLTDTNTVARAAGKFSNGGDFESGNSEYQYAADNATLSLTGSTTVVGWIKPESVTASTLFDIAGKWDGSNESYLLSQFGDEIRFYVDSSSNYATTDAANLATGTFYHVAAVYNSSAATVTIYVNGAVSASTITGTIPSSIGDDAGRFQIGAEDSTTTAANFYDGIIDEARVYNRALSSAEVSQLYNFAPGPVGYWKMDENTGTSAYDASGNAYTGTLTGGPTWKPGKYGAGVNFDATNDYINVSGLTWTPTTFTVSWWFNPNTCEASNNVIGSTNSWGAYMFHCAASGSGLVGTDLNNRMGLPSGTITTGSWNHYAFTYAGGTGKFYKNGVLITTGTGMSNPTAWGGFRMGSADTATINGSIDEVKIYGYARSADQIVSDMNAGHPNVGSPVGSALGHWRFDEGALNTCSGGTNDACNSGNQGSALDGTFNADAAYTQSGKFGKAVTLDGTGDYVDAGTNASLNVNSGFTLSAWVNRSSVVTGPIMGKFTAASRAYTFDIVSGTVRLFATNTAGSWDAERDSSITLSTNTWYHIVGVYNPSTNLDIYINGVLSNGTLTGTIPSSVRTSTANFQIGGNSSTADYSTGTLDEPKIYNYALTADQVKLDMNRGSAQVLGALSDNSTYQKQAANQEYCVPGDSTSCAAPVARWDFSENTGSTAYDTSGNGNTGTWNGTLGSQWKPGKVGPGGNFNGTDNYVNVPDSTSLISSSAITYSIWHKSAGNGDQGVRGIMISKNTTYLDRCAGTEALFSIRINNVQQTLYGGAGTCPTVGVWTHYVGTYDGTTARLYVNGVQKNTLSAAGTITDDSNPLTIGRWDGTSSYFVNGQLDEVRVFNYARSAAQVAWDYNKGSPVGHWRLDECQGDKLNDSAGNSLTATVTNTTPGTCTTSSTFWGGSDGTGAGKRNYAPDFDGSNDVATVTNATAIDFDTGLATGMSFAAWIYADSDGEGDVGEFLDKGANTYCRVDNESGGLDVECQIDLGTTDANVNIADAFAISGWHHVVISYDDDGDDDSTIYIDGISRGTGSGSGAPATTDTNDLLIGGSSAANFDGKIDDFRVYNYGLTATQVKELYGGGAIRFGPVTGAP